MEKQQVLIRDACANDADLIAKVHVESWRSAYKDLLPADMLANLSRERRKNWWERVIADNNPNVSLLVATLDGNVVGFAYSAPAEGVEPSKNWGELGAIYSLEETWGKGVGWQLWSAAQKFLAEIGYETIMLWVLEGNDRAIQFYERVGFIKDKSPEGTKLEQLGAITVREHRYLLTDVKQL